jgi:hypothetical protein
MKKEKLLITSLILSSAAFIISLFSLVLNYGLFLEIKSLAPYIVKPQPIISPTTTIFPSTFVGRFMLVTSPIIAAIISIVILILLIFTFRKS